MWKNKTTLNMETQFRWRTLSSLCLGGALSRNWSPWICPACCCPCVNSCGLGMLRDVSSRLALGRKHCGSIWSRYGTSSGTIAGPGQSSNGYRRVGRSICMGDLFPMKLKEHDFNKMTLKWCCKITRLDNLPGFRRESTRSSQTCFR